MSFFLLYGQDGCGKSLQMTNLCKASENHIYLSLEVKDEDLLTASGINAVPVLKLYDDYTINPFATLETLNAEIEKILKSDIQTVVIDGISQLRKFAIEVALAEENKERAAAKKPVWIKIPKEAYGVWEDAGKKVFNPLDRLGNWCHIRKRNVFLTARMKENYVDGTKTGDVLDFKEFVRFSVDVKVKIVKDGRGYVARFEKVPDWANEGAMEVPLDKNGLYVQLMMRGLLK